MTDRLRRPVRTSGRSRNSFPPMKGRNFCVAPMKGMVFILLFLLGLATAYSQVMEVGKVEIGGKPGETTITLEFTGPVSYRSFTLEIPPRLVLDIPGAVLKEPRTIEVRNKVVETIRYEQYQPDTVRVVVDLTQPAESRVRKSGKKLLLHFSLPREVRARLLNEERVKARVEEEMKRKLAIEEKARIKREKEESRRLARARQAELKVKEEEKRRLEAERKVREKEEEERGKAEEKAKQLLEKGMKRETEFKAKEAVAEQKLAEETARREAKERKKNIKTSLSQGKKHYRANRFDGAIKEFEAVLALDAENTEARSYLSLAKERRETSLLAKAKAVKDEETEKKIVEYLNRGKRYYVQERYAEAISEGEKVLVLSPDNKPAENLVMRSKKEVLKRDKEKAQKEKEIVEKRRTLDVTRAVYTSPVDYVEAINPEKLALAGEGTAAGSEGGRTEEKITGLEKKAAETMVSMNFQDTDLSDVILYLSKLSNLTIALDETALDELENPRVSIYTPTEIPLTAALNLLLKVKGLDYVVKENYIWVTKKGQEEETVTKAYRLKYGIRKIRKDVTLTLPEEEQ